MKNKKAAQKSKKLIRSHQSGGLYFMNMNRHLNHFNKPLLPSIFISIWPLFGLYLWLQMGSLFALIIGSLLGHTRQLKLLTCLTIIT